MPEHSEFSNGQKWDRLFRDRRNTNIKARRSVLDRGSKGICPSLIYIWIWIPQGVHVGPERIRTGTETMKANSDDNKFHIPVKPAQCVHFCEITKPSHSHNYQN